MTAKKETWIVRAEVATGVWAFIGRPALGTADAPLGWTIFLAPEHFATQEAAQAAAVALQISSPRDGVEVVQA